MASAEISGTAVALESEAVAQGHWLRTAAAAAPALACRCFLYQPVGHVLLLVQRAGWIQSFSGALRSAGVNEGSGGSQQSRDSRVPSAVLRTSYLWYGGVWSNRKSGDGDECHGSHGCSYRHAVSASGFGLRARSHRQRNLRHKPRHNEL